MGLAVLLSVVAKAPAEFQNSDLPVAAFSKAGRLAWNSDARIVQMEARLRSEMRKVKIISSGVGFFGFDGRR